MKIIVGLGNPGKEYEGTRHNVGFTIIDKLSEKGKWQENSTGVLEYFWITRGKEKIELVKPQTFMNNSGKALAYVRKKHPKLSPSNILIIHDDLDIELGRVKMTYAKTSGGHKGVESVIKSLRTDKFWRLRVGIKPKRATTRSPKDFILGKFTPAEQKLITKNTKKIIEGIELWLKKPERAMGLINQK